MVGLHAWDWSDSSSQNPPLHQAMTFTSSQTQDEMRLTITYKERKSNSTKCQQDAWQFPIEPTSSHLCWCSPVSKRFTYGSHLVPSKSCTCTIVDAWVSEPCSRGGIKGGGMEFKRSSENCMSMELLNRAENWSRVWRDSPCHLLHQHHRRQVSLLLWWPVAVKKEDLTIFYRLCLHEQPAGHSWEVRCRPSCSQLVKNDTQQVDMVDLLLVLLSCAWHKRKGKKALCREEQTGLLRSIHPLSAPSWSCRVRAAHMRSLGSSAFQMFKSPTYAVNLKNAFSRRCSSHKIWSCYAAQQTFIDGIVTSLPREPVSWIVGMPEVLPQRWSCRCVQQEPSMLALIW